MTKEHTPGPWKIDYLDKNGQRVVRGEHIEICTCWHHCVIEQEMEANAHLIAAAPAMYAVLTRLVFAADAKLLSEKHKVIQEARDAIAKAEGRE